MTNIINKIKAKARDRKGLGMELAVMVLLLVLGCSTLLLTSALWNRNILTEKEEQIIERLAIDEYAESEISKSSFAEGKYVCVNDKTTNDLKIKSQKEDGDTLLLEFEVAIESKDGKTIKKITSWTYN